MHASTYVLYVWLYKQPTFFILYNLGDWKPSKCKVNICFYCHVMVFQSPMRAISLFTCPNLRSWECRECKNHLRCWMGFIYHMGALGPSLHPQQEQNCQTTGPPAWLKEWNMQRNSQRQSCILIKRGLPVKWKFRSMKNQSSEILLSLRATHTQPYGTQWLLIFIWLTKADDLIWKSKRWGETS